jgi:hypothetical protein
MHNHNFLPLLPTHLLLNLCFGSLVAFIIARKRPYNVANLRLTRPLNCGVLGPVYSKLMPSCSCMHRFSNALFSQASSHWMVFTMCLIGYCWSDCNFFISNTTCSGKWDFAETNTLQHILVQTSSTMIQNFDQPKLGDCTKLISTISLSPGILLVFSVVLPAFR